MLFENLDKIDKRTVSIKRTVYNFSQMTLLNVQYDLEIENIITKTTWSYNRVFRVLNVYM